MYSIHFVASMNCLIAYTDSGTSVIRCNQFLMSPQGSKQRNKHTPTITFYHKRIYGGQDKAAIEPIAQGIRIKRFDVGFPANCKTDGEVGIYARDRGIINTDFLINMFH